MVILQGRQISRIFNSGFPGGTVVKNPPANAGDTGSSPGPGRSHMPWSNQAREPQLLSLCSRAHVPQLLDPTRLVPVLHNKRSHRNNKEQPLLTATRESPCTATKTQCSQKQINKINKFFKKRIFNSYFSLNI